MSGDNERVFDFPGSTTIALVQAVPSEYLSSAKTSTTSQTQISTTMRLLSIFSAVLIAAPLVMGVDWTVQVGASNGFTFTPNEIHPAIGDTVTFTYLTRNREYPPLSCASPSLLPTYRFGDDYDVHLSLPPSSGWSRTKRVR